MKPLHIEGDVLQKVVTALAQSDIFGSLGEKALNQIAQRAGLIQYESDEAIVKVDEPSDSFLLIIEGQVAILHSHQTTGELIEIGRIKPFHVIGEISLMLKKSRTATVQAIQPTLMLKFDSKLFDYMFENIPAFGPAICRNLAKRVFELSSNISLPKYQATAAGLTKEIFQIVPLDLIIRHRVLPLRMDGNKLLIGFVHDPTPGVLSGIRSTLPGVELQMVNIENDFFDSVLQSQAGVPDLGKKRAAEGKIEAAAPVQPKSSPQLDAILKRLVAEGASDLHLSACQTPYWRIDGDLKAISDISPLGSEEVFDLIGPIMEAQTKNAFLETNDADFTYTISGVGRFRVNIYRDDHGVSAAFRVIPSKVMSLDQLGMPATLKTLCEHSMGLLLVTGPAGSGKSTTLAALVDHINKTRPDHIITLEAPIEFVHQSDRALINQRQIGRHTQTYHSALRAVLREDPDVILIGELNDLETIKFALEIANTGHLVLGSLHTSGAISTVTRIVDAFPADQQNQVRSNLCDTLKGVVSQMLCKCVGGGRVAAQEILVVNLPIANLIRENKLSQVASAMQTGKSHGHRLLVEELAALVKRRKIDYQEAMSKAPDKQMMEKLLADIPKTQRS